MAITPRMSNTAHRMPLRGHGARTPLWTLHRSCKCHKERGGRALLLSRGGRGPGTFACGKCWPPRRVCESNVQWLTSVVSPLLSRPSWSRRFPCCPPMRVRRRKRNTGPIRRRCRSTAATPAGKDLLVRHVSLRRVRRAGGPLLSLSSPRTSQRFAIAGAIRSGARRRRGNSAYMTPPYEAASRSRASQSCSARGARCFKSSCVCRAVLQRGRSGSQIKPARAGSRPPPKLPRRLDPRSAGCRRPRQIDLSSRWTE